MPTSTKEINNKSTCSSKTSSNRTTPTSSASSFNKKQTNKKTNNNNRDSQLYVNTNEHNKSFSMAPSPTLFNNVSLAQAEIDDDYDLNDLMLNEDVEFVDNDELSEISNANANKPPAKLDESINVNEYTSEQIEAKLNEQESHLASSSTSSTTSSASASSASTVSVEKLNNEVDIIKSFFSQNDDLVLANKLNNFKSNLLSSKSNGNGSGKQLGMDEKISNEAKEYWATIDLYNNSKLAFNKRCKSVKVKRDKLNVELAKRKTKDLSRVEEKVEEHAENGKQQEEPAEAQIELCSCVKCAIVYHEALIKGITDIHAIVCKKCNSKLISCKCCSSNLSSASLSAGNSSALTNLTTSSRNSVENLDSQSRLNGAGVDAVKTKPANTPFKEEFNQFDEKLFNIKSELINLSESSLDVFQLLLQLSDTILELNNQLNTAANSNRLVLLNSLFDKNSSNLNLLNTLNANSLSLSQNYLNDEPVINQSVKPTDNRTNLIDDLIKKTLNSNTALEHSGSQSATPKPHPSNSISNIINKLNQSQASEAKKLNVQLNEANSPLLISPSSSCRQIASNHSNSSIKKQLFASQSASKQYVINDSFSSSALSTLSYESQTPSRLIENLYDKTSVTQFVDSLLNSGHKKELVNSNLDELSQSSSGCYTSLISTVTQNTDDSNQNSENIYHCIDDELVNAGVKPEPKQHSWPAKQHVLTATTSITNQILARQPFSSIVTNKTSLKQSFRHDHSESKQMKSSTSSSSSSSSSGCGGSSSLCSTSNADLTSLLSSTNITNITNDESSIKANDYNRRSLSVKSHSEQTSSNLDYNRHSTASSGSSVGSKNQLLISTCDAQQDPLLISPTSINSAKQQLSPCSVAGLAATFNSHNRSGSCTPNNYQQRSNSVSIKPKNTNPIAAGPQISNLVHTASIANRKPSFKFESNILNRVQNMNMSKVKNNFSKPEVEIKPKNEEAESMSHLIKNGIINNPNFQLMNKRNSLNRSENVFDNQMKLLKRQQSMNKPTTPTISKPESTSETTTPTAAANNLSMMLNNKSSNHQISLDSGIYLPSECDDACFNVNVR